MAPRFSFDTQFNSILVTSLAFMVALAIYAKTVPHAEAMTLEYLGEYELRDLIPPEMMIAPELPKAEEAAPEPPAPVIAEKPKSRAVSAAPAAPRRDRGIIDHIAKGSRAPGALRELFEERNVERHMDLAYVTREGAPSAPSSIRGDAGEAPGFDFATPVAQGIRLERGGEVGVEGLAREEVPEVDGELSPEVIREEMKKKLRAVKDCYERELKRFPSLAGKVVIGFEIQASGEVVGAALLEDSVDHERLGTCILSRAQAWRFPAPASGTVKVALPIVLSPAPGTR
jgi:outer membrane biosynthesis protein TonB